MRIARVASNCGQQITLARNGAKADQQSIAVIPIKLSAAEKFNIQSPVMGEREREREITKQKM
jgi:hypothetical protein